MIPHAALGFTLFAPQDPIQLSRDKATRLGVQANMHAHGQTLSCRRVTRIGENSRG